MNDTIVAPATAYGTGSVCIVRVSGSMAYHIARSICKRELKPRFATFCKIFVNKTTIDSPDITEIKDISNNLDIVEIKNTTIDEQIAIDEAIVIYFRSPFSFTGEDVVEFQIHGGYVVSEILILQIIKLGARIATPGEFSKRAFLNGKMDLQKAESISKLINSRTFGAVKILSRSMNGEICEYVEFIRKELVKILAFTETCIDYAEEDLPKNVLSQAYDMLDSSISTMQEICDASIRRAGLIDGFKVAIIGKPNVGKSSILNSLLRYKRAIISDEEGTTRDKIEESLKIGTHIIKLIDTAGIRDTQNKVEKAGIALSFDSAKEADILLCVFDSSNIIDSRDIQILEFVKELNCNKIFVLNKSDLIQKFDIDILPKGADIISICANKSVDGIIDRLVYILNSKNYDGIMLTSTRQIQSCKNAKEYLINAKNNLKDNSLEIFAFEINMAIKEISSITRPFSRDEILDEMFSNFCLGK